MAIFRPKPWVNPFGKTSIFRLFDLLVFRGQKGDFSFQNMVKDIFLAYFEVKKKVSKPDIFDQKPWINPSRKMAIFRLFKLLVSIAQKGVFSFQNVEKTFSRPIFPKKMKLQKWSVLFKNHGLTPLEKWQFFYFFNLFFFIAQKGVFSFQNIVKTFFLISFTLKKEVGKMAIF